MGWKTEQTNLKRAQKDARQARQERKETIREMLVKNEEEGKAGTNLTGWKLDSHGRAVRG